MTTQAGVRMQKEAGIFSILQQTAPKVQRLAGWQSVAVGAATVSEPVAGEKTTEKCLQMV